MPPEAGFWQILNHHVRRGHLRAAGTEILVAAIMLLIAGMMLLGVNISELHNIGVSVQQSDAALLQIAEVDNNILGLELSMRGYALSQRPDYVQSYRQRSTRLRTSLRDLSVRLADQPEQAARLADLNRFAAERFATFDALLALGPQGRDTVIRTIVDPQLRTTRIAAQDVLYAVRTDELARTSARQGLGERKVEQTFLLAAVIVVVAFALAICGLVLAGGGRVRPAAHLLARLSGRDPEAA